MSSDVNTNALYLPSLGAFLGKLCKVDGGVGMFLLVFLAARLNKVGI